ncbi:hypothetical protein [Floridanema aerugineum]|uniref:Uncharacterized protein n=1 Tax=Floridaenema aerugineum BLCC-F46 TaxID=3153654 RepID=A0ABV4X3F3_9CYAN
MTSDIHEDDRQESGKYDPQDNPGTETHIPVTEEGDRYYSMFSDRQLFLAISQAIYIRHFQKPIFQLAVQRNRKFFRSLID